MSLTAESWKASKDSILSPAVCCSEDLEILMLSTSLKFSFVETESPNLHDWLSIVLDTDVSQPITLCSRLHCLLRAHMLGTAAAPVDLCSSQSTESRASPVPH